MKIPALMDIKKLLFAAIQASLLAGKEILEVYDLDFSVEQKADNSPLTLADKNAHNAICKFLESTNFPVLSEEGKMTDYSERSKWKYFWMVDPLDGTKEFVKRNGEFTVNIALIHNQRSILGVIFVPVTQTLYFAAETIGAFKLQISDIDSAALSLEEMIQSASSLPLSSVKDNFTVVASRSHLSEETEMFIAGLKMNHKVVDFISSGSSIKLCLVAEGSADVYPRFAPTMEWDTAAGQAICEISGKEVVDYTTNRSLLYNKPDLLNNWFVVQ